jgi:hypothetical protein
LIKSPEHRRVVAAGRDVDRNHPAGISDADDLPAGELPVDVTGQRCQMRDAAEMRFTVQDCLVEVRDAPPVGDVVSELGAQAFGGLAGVGVAPGSERR